MAFLPLTTGGGGVHHRGMFLIHCSRCDCDVLVGAGSLLSLHRVSTGFVAYARCGCGRACVAEIPNRTGARAATPAPIDYALTA